MVAGEENGNKGEFPWVGSPTWLTYQLQNRMLGLNFVDTRLVDCPSHAEGVSRWVHFLLDMIQWAFSSLFRPWAQK